MSEVFDIQQQWFDKFGGLLVGGKVYYGKPNTDPTLPVNQIDVFSDRAFTVALPNPQTIGADGRVENKPWLNERYSIQVDDKDNVMEFESADNGEDPPLAGVNIIIPNVTATGINALSGTATGVSAYENLQTFSFIAPTTNTGNLTLEINSLGAKPIKFNFREQIGNGFFQAGQAINIIFNTDQDAFMWMDEGRGITLLTNIGGTANAITASGGPSGNSNIDKQLYVLKTLSANTGAVTLKIDTLSTIPIKYNGIELVAGDLKANQLIIVAYDSVAGEFNLSSSLPNQFLIQSKMCIPFFDIAANIPVGFVVCDGSNGTPNLVGKYLKGSLADGSNNNSTGGSTTTGPTTLTEAQIPEHDHSIPFSQSGNNAGSSLAGVGLISATDTATGTKGGGGSHTHPDTEPPFITLLWIMKT